MDESVFLKICLGGYLSVKHNNSIIDSVRFAKIIPNILFFYNNSLNLWQRIFYRTRHIMKRKILTYSLVFSVAALLPIATSCKKKKVDDQEAEKTEKAEKKNVEPKTIQVEVFTAMPVKGDQADYFSISGPDGANTITVTGTPDPEAYSPRGIIKMEVDLSVLKPLNDQVYEIGDGSPLKFRFLDADREELSYISVGKTDMELIAAELEKATPGTITVILKTDEYERSYNEFFEKAKYVRLENAEIEGVKEHEREEKMAEAERKKEERAAEAERRREERAAAASSSSSSRSSSYSSSSSDDDYDDYDDDDRTSMKKALKKAGKKVSEKAKSVKDKAAEKLNDWLDR